MTKCCLKYIPPYTRNIPRTYLRIRVYMLRKAHLCARPNGCLIPDRRRRRRRRHGARASTRVRVYC